MNAAALTRSSLGYYWRTHLGVILGAALGALVLTGALLVGDSVKGTLRKQGMARVGKINGALLGGERTFRSALAGETGADTSAALVVRASAARSDGKSRVNQAQLVGVDEKFWKLSPAGAAPAELTGDQVILNDRLAGQLGAAVGDTLILRVEKPSAFSRDAPLSGDENEVIAIRAKVAGIADEVHFGRFALQASQVPPFTIFISLAALQERIEQRGLANLLLSPTQNGDALRKAAESHWKLQDASLELRKTPTGEVELRTSRVFLDRAEKEAAPKGVDGLTYLVNELRSGDKATPYSMVTALDAPSSLFLPAELADDEIAISQWLAEDLGVREGAKISLKYFVMGERRQLEERSREFTVLAVIPQDEPRLNSSWMPQFPGLADKGNCRDWQPGFQMDMSRIRDKDEEYWDKYKGTPKAFVNIMVGQQMWANRWGDLTSIRYPADTDLAKVESAITAKLSPEQLGMSFVDLQQRADAATDAPVDFAQLFVAFSFFLLIAAAVLTGLLFVFSLEQRNAEAGLLLALGWPRQQVRRLFLQEGLVLAAIGSVLGAAGGWLYTLAVLRALSTVWQGAVGNVAFQFLPSPLSFLIGAVGSVVIAATAMWWASRRQLSNPARALLASTVGEEIANPEHRRKRAWSRPIAIVSFVAAIGMALFAPSGSSETFFGAGSLLLIAGLAWMFSRFRKLTEARQQITSIAQLGRRGATLRRGRSLATIGVLASGVFMVVAVSAFRKSGEGDWSKRTGGTGGFALLGESSLPIYEDLNSPQGRETFGLDEKIVAAAKIVPMRVREGDDASCLNLNRALQPRILGVKAEELRSRGAFQFGSIKEDALRGTATVDPKTIGWGVLEADIAGGEPSEIPGVVDQNTLMWALKMKLGDVIEYTDGRGEKLRVRLVGTVAGSLLQGNVLIAERHFIEHFPAIGGYRYFLIDAPADQYEQVAAHLSRQLQDRGFEVTPAARRLAEFEAVENTYLSIFQALGGLGLLLGSVGLAIVVARNVLERRREFGLLAAVGFRPRQLRQLVFAEHRALIFAGLGIGAASALVGVWPQLRHTAGGFPFTGAALLMLALVAGALFWTWLATRLSLRGPQASLLREE